MILSPGNQQVPENSTEEKNFEIVNESLWFWMNKYYKEMIHTLIGI